MLWGVYKQHVFFFCFCSHIPTHMDIIVNINTSTCVRMYVCVFTHTLCMTYIKLYKYLHWVNHKCKNFNRTEIFCWEMCEFPVLIVLININIYCFLFNGRYYCYCLCCCCCCCYCCCWSILFCIFWHCNQSKWTAIKT